MEQFLYYLLRASVVMVLFYGFYKLFFGKNTFHRINRLMLILLSITVCILPLFRFSLLPEKKREPIVTENFTFDLSEIPIVEYNYVEPQIVIPWQQILFVLFIVGLAFALTRYLIGLAQLMQIIRKSEKQLLADNSVLCVTEKEVSPFSWFNYIVLLRNDMNAENRAIINHERAHIHLLHSLDMIFFDLFTSVFWFNPFSWLMRREIQSVHEYQADDKVIQNGIDAKQYQLLLIRKSVGEHKFSLANNFRQRDLHKRIRMMTKSKTNKRMKWNYTVALPVLFLAMVALSVPKLNAKVSETETLPEIEEINKQSEDSVVVSLNHVDLSTNPLELGETRIISKESLNDEKITISGFVKGKDGFMPGVAVLIKGSANGTITDTEGKFVIQTDKDDVLQFMMVGYKLFEYKAEEAVNNLVVSLQPEEVVVVGSGKMEDFEKDNDKIVARGTDISKGKPLVIVDGKEIVSLSDVKPDDIESMTVLKDKSVAIAVEIFGEKAKDGVIIITTKKGSKSKTDLKEIFTNKFIVIDGVSVGKGFSQSDFDPDQIQSISILKDESAIALYGDEGKDGAILITTKKGKTATPSNDLSLPGVSGDKKPLIVVDGKVKGKDFELNSISPSDIESMSVFKDKVALDMYGEEGKDGVVQIMTKENLKMKVSINDGKDILDTNKNRLGVNVFKTGEIITFGKFDNTDIFINGKKSTVEDVKRLHSKNVNFLSSSPANLDYDSELHKKYNVPRNRSIIEVR